MLEDVKQFVNILCKWKITPNQFFLCWLLYWDHRRGVGGRRILPDDPTAMENLYRYTSCVGSWKKSEVEDLKEKGLIEMPEFSKQKIGKDQLDHMQITQKFINGFLATRSNFDEFFEAYPTWIQNFDHPSKSDINLKVCNIEDLEDTYMRIVKTNKRHKRIMEILDWAKQNDLIKYNIKNFVESRMWNRFEELMEKEGTSTDEDSFGNRKAF